MIGQKTKLRIARAVGISIYGQQGITELMLTAEPDSYVLEEVVSLLHGLEAGHKIQISKEGLKMPMDEQKGALAAVFSVMDQLKLLELSVTVYGDYHAAYMAGQYLNRVVSRAPIEYILPDFLVGGDEQNL